MYRQAVLRELKKIKKAVISMAKGDPESITDVAVALVLERIDELISLDFLKEQQESIRQIDLFLMKLDKK